MRSAILILIGIGMWSASPSLWAQNRSTAEIAGTVMDPSGAALPGVNITVANETTGVAVKAISNTAAHTTFRFSGPVLIR